MHSKVIFWDLFSIVDFQYSEFCGSLWLVFKGYELGSSFLTSVQESGILDRIFKGAGILGLMVIGAMDCNKRKCSSGNYV